MPEEQEHLSSDDLAIILLLCVALLDFGFPITTLDLSSPGLVKTCGPHKVYEVAVRLPDGQDFPEDEFCEQIEKYTQVCKTIKPHYYGIEKYPARVGYCFDTTTGTASTKILQDYNDFYVSIFI